MGQSLSSSDARPNRRRRNHSSDDDDDNEDEDGGEGDDVYVDTDQSQLTTRRFNEDMPPPPPTVEDTNSSRRSSRSRRDDSHNRRSALSRLCERSLSVRHQARDASAGHGEGGSSINNSNRNNNIAIEAAGNAEPASLEEADLSASHQSSTELAVFESPVPRSHRPMVLRSSNTTISNELVPLAEGVNHSTTPNGQYHVPPQDGGSTTTASSLHEQQQQQSRYYHYQEDEQISSSPPPPPPPPPWHNVIHNRRTSAGSSDSGVSDIPDDDYEMNIIKFVPTTSRHCEWMHRSIESLCLGHVARAPLLTLDLDASDGDYEADFYLRRRSTASTFGGGGGGRRRSSQGSFPGGRRGSLTLMVGHGSMQGGTLANYYNRPSRRLQVPTDVDRSIDRQGRRGSAHGPMYRRRNSMATTGAQELAGRSGSNVADMGPNVLLSIMARENMGRSCYARGTPASQCLMQMGGHALFKTLDTPAAGIVSEVAFLAAAIDSGDWTETQALVTRLAPRLIGDPMAAQQQQQGPSRAIDDPTLPPTAPKFFAGGGRLGLERDAFVLAGGVEVMLRIFREKSFVGQDMALTFDARDLSEEIMATRLAPCWNEALASLRELVYAMPSLVEGGALSENKGFLTFLFTLLSHDTCFDGTAALIEEMLSILSQTPQPVSASNDSNDDTDSPIFTPLGRVSAASTFYLGNVNDLYGLWRGFNCRHLAHFCRILALLVFEPEDRQLLESPTVLKSIELLQLRRNRAIRSGRDATVDMNQAIVLGDMELLRRLLQVLRVMNYAPSLRRFAPYHVLANFPFIADTLVMLGLAELDTWTEIDRQDVLARELLLEANVAESGRGTELSGLGAVADMLEGLARTLTGNPREVGNQVGHIVHVISAAQQAGIIVGRNRRGRQSNNTDSEQHNVGGSSDAPARTLHGIAIDGTTIQGLASVAGILTDQVLLRRLYQNAGQGMDDNGPPRAVGLGVGGSSGGNDHRLGYLINTPEDAANSLQFNAMLLGPYQVEVLFVLCTLLGGRRKVDVQDRTSELGLIPILDDMFQRLPWCHGDSPTGGASGVDEPHEQPNGIHGPGCECTPESALCVQYLRLLHNFCDRDCDNYHGRRLLLSDGECRVVLGEVGLTKAQFLPGLLSKIIGAFTRELDDSPYRFWLASCIESYLRGSSTSEQIFAAKSGLLNHLIAEISSERLHCAGSLQTSFDLLGELGKGNAEVVRLLVEDLDEDSFRKLMSVAAANLVDSNVFIRSLLLTLERLAVANSSVPLYLGPPISGSTSCERSGDQPGAYLTHSWWETNCQSLSGNARAESPGYGKIFVKTPLDWFPVNSDEHPVGRMTSYGVPNGLEASIGHFGWVFSPVGDALTKATFLPNTVERLSWFLAANQARLLRDLLGVVDLRNINHENICCLNTAVVIAIFAFRRHQLSLLLEDLRQMNDAEVESRRRTPEIGDGADVVDRAFIQAMRFMDLDHRRESSSYARATSLPLSMTGSHIGDRADVMRNFREVLWFWLEYYTHRGRDRLSLEFSSHLSFREWEHVVALMTADDTSRTSLATSSVRLPRSPYQRAGRVVDIPQRI